MWWWRTATRRLKDGGKAGGTRYETGQEKEGQRMEREEKGIWNYIWTYCVSVSLGSHVVRLLVDTLPGVSVMTTPIDRWCLSSFEIMVVTGEIFRDLLSALPFVSVTFEIFRWFLGTLPCWSSWSSRIVLGGWLLSAFPIVVVTGRVFRDLLRALNLISKRKRRYGGGKR